MAISDWLPAERPRERLLASGPGALSDAELLAVMLRTGVRGKSAVDLGRDLLGRCGGVAGLFGPALPGIKGLGPAERAQLEAGIELARPSIAQGLYESPALTLPGARRGY